MSRRTAVVPCAAVQGTSSAAAPRSRSAAAPRRRRARAPRRRRAARARGRLPSRRLPADDARSTAPATTTQADRAEVEEQAEAAARGVGPQGHGDRDQASASTTRSQVAMARLPPVRAPRPSDGAASALAAAPGRRRCPARSPAGSGDHLVDRPRAPCPSPAAGRSCRLPGQAVALDLLVEIGARHLERARGLRDVPVVLAELAQQEVPLRLLLERLEGVRRRRPTASPGRRRRRRAGSSRSTSGRGHHLARRQDQQPLDARSAARARCRARAAAAAASMASSPKLAQRHPGRRRELLGEVRHQQRDVVDAARAAAAPGSAPR